METRVQPAEWGDFLERFSRQHEGWLCTLETTQYGTGRITDAALDQVALEEKGSIVLRVRHGPTVVIREIGSPRSVTFITDDQGGHQALRIRGQSEELDLVFRVASHPEMLDGLVFAQT